MAQTRKAAAIEFLHLASHGRVREAFERHVAKDFRHHNPWFRGDAASLMMAMEENAKQYPKKRQYVLAALEDGDMVAIYSRVRHEADDIGVAIVHLFRFADSHIVELWDVGQEVPATTVNENGMF